MVQAEKRMQKHSRRDTLPGAVTFTQQYQNEKRGKWSVEIPEVQELVHIIMAITPTGKKDSNFVNRRTNYYREVLSTFDAYQHEPIVQQIDKLLQAGDYSTVKMNSVAFAFEQHKIVKPGPYNYLAWESTNNLDTLRDDLQLFAAKTHFRKFYADHAAYYDSLKKSMTTLMPIDKQWTWCEREFPARYDSYQVTFSPLAHRSHSANHFQNSGFSEAVVFISPTRNFPGQNRRVTEGLNTRLIFTEIDHNYVNPVSETYKPGIEKAFANRDRWVTNKLSTGYDTPFLVFNEYMTWAVFTLYCLEHFSPEDATEIIRTTQEFMSTLR